MNPIQKQLLELLYNLGTLDLKYRYLARKIGEKYPEKIKYHLNKLSEKGLIRIDEANKKIMRVTSMDTLSNVNSLPIYGSANCGEALCVAEDRIEGYLKVSEKVLPDFSRDLYVLRAVGDSMNDTKVGVGKKPIQDGDYVVVDSKKRNVKEDDIVVSVIDGAANIKQLKYNQDSGNAFLIANSTEDYFPIVLHESDNFHVMGTVVDVISNL